MSNFIDDITFFLSSLFHSIAVTVSITIAVTVSILFALHFDTIDDNRKVLEFILPVEFFQFRQITAIQHSVTHYIDRKIGYPTDDRRIGYD